LLLFAEYIVEGVRAKVDLSDAEFRFANFEPVDTATIDQLITKHRNKQRQQNLAPTWLVKQFVNELALFIAVMVNASFWRTLVTQDDFTTTYICIIFVVMQLQENGEDDIDCLQFGKLFVVFWLVYYTLAVT